MPDPKKNLSLLYNEYGKDINDGQLSEEEFIAKFSNPKNRQSFFEAYKEDFENASTQEEFDAFLGYSKATDYFSKQNEQFAEKPKKDVRVGVSSPKEIMIQNPASVASRVSTEEEAKIKKEQVLEKQQALFTPAEPIGELEALENAFKRGWAQGEIADMLALGQTPSVEDVRRIAELNKQNQNLPSSQAYQDFNNSPTVSEALSQWVKNPFEITSQLVLESLTALARHGYSRALTGAAIGSAVPGIGTGVGYVVGAGLAGYNVEVASSILESFSDAGIDITDKKSLQQAFDSEDLFQKARSFAMKRGIPITIFDMATAGIAGKLLSKPTSTILGKLGRGTGELGIQAAGGGGGELAAQITSGQKINPTAILAEMIGEVGPGSVDVAVGTLIERAKQGEDISKDIASINIPKEQFEDMVDVSSASGEITDQEGAILKESYNQAQEAKTVIPEEHKDNPEVVLRILQKNRLEEEKKTVDGAFKESIQLKIDEINTEIKNIVSTQETVTPEETVQETSLQGEVTPMGEETGKEANVQTPPSSTEPNNLGEFETETKVPEPALEPSTDNQVTEQVTKLSEPSTEAQALEQERDTKINQISKPDVSLDFLPDDHVGLSVKTGDKITVKAGKRKTQREATLADVQKNIKKVSETLQKLVDCL